MTITLGQNVAAKYSLSADGMTAYLMPSTLLATGRTSNEHFVGRGIMDLAGNYSPSPDAEEVLKSLPRKSAGFLGEHDWCGFLLSRSAFLGDSHLDFCLIPISVPARKRSPFLGDADQRSAVVGTVIGMVRNGLSKRVWRRWTPNHAITSLRQRVSVPARSKPAVREGGSQARFEQVAEQARIVQQIFSWIGRDRCSLAEVCRRLQKAGEVTATGSESGPAKPCATFSKTRRIKVEPPTERRT